MSVLSEPRAASVPTGAVAFYRTLAAWSSRGYARLHGNIVLATLAAGAVAGLVRTGNPFVAWAAGLLFGWPGVAGASAGQLLGAWAAQGSFFTGLGLAFAGSPGEETVVLGTHSEPEGRRVFLLGGGMVLALTLVAVPLAVFLPRGGSWAVLLYVVPILWSALEYGLRGGVLATSASGVCYLAGAALLASAGYPGSPADLWAWSADLLILSLVGAFVGRSREHEVRLRDELESSNRLLRRDLLRVTQALTQAVEAKDSYTEGHLRRVCEYAVAVGSRLGLRGRDLEMIHFASMLHDIGKIGIPEMEGTRHPGYPFGLVADEIPLGARIIAVVDAFDAMTTTRPYREALPVESAVAELRRERGYQFDPAVVDAFLEVLAERPWAREESWH